MLALKLLTTGEMSLSDACAPSVVYFMCMICITDELLQKLYMRCSINSVPY